MSRRPVWLGLALFLALVPMAAGAAERRVTFAQAVDIAMENNYQIRATKNSLKAGREDVGIARGFLLPSIGLEQRATRTNNPPGVFMSKLNQERFTQADFAISSLNSPAPITDLQTMVTLDQTIFAGKTLIGLAMARKEYSAKGEDFGRKKEEILLSVARAYLQVHTAGEYVGVARAGLGDGREHMRSAEARYDNGLGLYSDVLRAKTAVIEAEQRIVTAEKDLSVAKRSLGLVLGLTGPVDAAEEKLEFPLKDLQYYENGAESRKDVKALRMRYENAKNGVRLAESKYLPTVGVHASYQLNDHNRILGSEGDSWWLVGVLRWDIFDGTIREFERSKAQYQQAETEERLKGLKASVAFEVAKAYLSVEEAAKNAELSKAALASAEEGRKLVKSRFENGLSPILDLLDVQVNVDRARASVVARENEYRLSVLEIGYEAGTIARDLGLQ